MVRGEQAGKITRAVYLFAMYTGLRAAVNLLRSFRMPLPRSSAIDGEVIDFGGLESLVVRVHARASPAADVGDSVGGMISVYSLRPGIPRWRYSLFRMSSHYGCGHLELAFYEKDNNIFVYAVRNILRSNLNRIGCSSWTDGLSLGAERDEFLVLEKIFGELRTHGLHTSLVPPEECVKLAVSPMLLKSATRDRTMIALTRKYKRMAKQLARSEANRASDSLIDARKQATGLHPKPASVRGGECSDGTLVNESR